MPDSTPTVLTIGTSDSSGTTGVQADLRTFAALGVSGTSVVTAVAARNTRGLAAVAEVPPEVVIAQIDTVLEDIGAAAIAIGALWSRSIAENVVDRVEAWGIADVVVSPSTVIIGEAGRLDSALISTMKRELFPLARIVTLDRVEAELFSGMAIRGADERREALRGIRGDNACMVYLAGVSDDAGAVDTLFDGDRFLEFPSRVYSSPDARAVMGAAIAAYLARGYVLLEAVEGAHRFVAEAARHALAVGFGPHPPRP